MVRPDLAIVIPAFNEEASIAAVVAQVKLYGAVIVVDDASTDGTARVATSAGAVVVRHLANRGYDAALSSGFEKAADLGATFAVTVDADGQHDPSLIAEFRRLLETSDLVLGVRPHTQRLAEWLFAGVARALYGVRDPLCGMKGYRMEVFRKLGHFDSYGSIGTELALFAVRNGYRFHQVEVPLRERLGAPRFGRLLKANYKILRALWLAIWKRPVAR